MVFNVQHPGESQHRAPVDVTKHAERCQARESGAEVFAESVLQRKRKEVDDAKPEAVAQHAQAAELLEEDQHVDEGARFRRRAKVPEDETSQEDSNRCESYADHAEEKPDV